ncbi:hypothetical protein GQR58_021318 [Nymphon striatum]|nr:hypothetical protein GQR58_021318 [Nymphon striatum]
MAVKSQKQKKSGKSGNPALIIRVIANESVTCDQAEIIRSAIHISLNGKSLVDAKIPRSRQVLTLAAQSKESVTRIEPLYAVDSTVLFMRMSVLLERSGNEIENYFRYELMPEPTSFVGESVIDGGGLLYAVTWQPFSTLKQVIYQYYSYVTSNYGISSTVVFDGYSDGPSVKDHEHNRRIMTSGGYAHIQIEHHAKVLSNQHGFLANDENKSKLIDQLSLRTKIYDVIRINADACIYCDCFGSLWDIAVCGANVIVVSNDTDVKIMLLYLYNSEMGDIIVKPFGS